MRRSTPIQTLRCVLFLLACLLGADAFAQTSAADQVVDLTAAVERIANAGAVDEAVDGPDGEALDGRLAPALEVALLLTALSLLPAALISVTSFTRIVIVLSFVRRSLSINELPPNPVLIGLALFLTSFVMAPVATEMHSSAYEPYQTGEIGAEVNYEEAIRWYTMAVEQGQSHAQFQLGEMYQKGKGVQRDQDKALELFKSATKGADEKRQEAAIRSVEARELPRQFINNYT